MERTQLQEKITGLYPNASLIEEGIEYLAFEVVPGGFHAFCEQLKNDPDLSFDYLFCVTAVDRPEAFKMVYHFQSTTHGHEMVIKVKIEDKENPKVDTVCDIWATAELHEREAYDLMGIEFNNHPDLRRLFLTDDWVGFPLRKDYVDEINVVNL